MLHTHTHTHTFPICLQLEINITWNYTALCLDVNTFSVKHFNCLILRDGCLWVWLLWRSLVLMGPVDQLQQWINGQKWVCYSDMLFHYLCSLRTQIRRRDRVSLQQSDMLRNNVMNACDRNLLQLQYKWPLWNAPITRQWNETKSHASSSARSYLGHSGAFS